MNHHDIFSACAVAVLGIALGASCDVLAGEEPSGPDWKVETLTGDWHGLRSELYKSGVDLEMTHKSDVLADVSGGIKRGTAWLGHTEARVGLDLDKLFGWDGTTAYLHYHSDLGSKFNRDYVGGIVGVDNIEVATNTAQFFHAWIQKQFFKNSLSVLAGLYPIDSEFYVTDTSALFIQPPYGMANELALTGKAGPPIFPLGALAVRVKYTTPDNRFYAMGAVTDGVPGDPANPHGTHIKLGDGDGTLSIAEFGYTPSPEVTPGDAAVAQKEEAEIFNKTAFGVWRYSSRFDSLASAGRRHPSYGAYFLAERTLASEQGHPSQGLSGFVRLGTASAEVNPLDWTVSVGLRYHGLIPQRDDDIAGIAVTVNHASRYSSANEQRETDIEATYRAQVRAWLALQPNVQYIINPGMDAALKNAWVVGFRTEVSF